MKKLIVLVLALSTLAISTVAYAAEVPFIQEGDYNSNVITLHEKLIDLGYFNLRPESPFGPATTEALKTLQENLGQEATGTISTQEDYESILALDHVVGKNLITDYEEKMKGSAYYSPDEKLEGEAVLHFDYRDSENDAYVDVVGFSNIVEPVAGTDYTLSFMAKGSGTIHTFFYPDTVASGNSNQNGSTKSGDGHITSALIDDWTQYIYTWHVKTGVEGLKNVLPVRVFKGTEVWVSKIKFEKGSKATEWSLPE